MRPTARPALEIAVSDTGAGIPADQLLRLFVPYQQAEAWTARQFGGTGLGLAISRELARKLGGDITVVSQPGEGSTFAVRVATGPLDGVPRIDAFEPEHFPAHAAHAVDCGQKLGIRILLAEDGPDNQRLIAHILRKAGAKVEIAENGRQAVDFALEAAYSGQPHDMVLMDMIMPHKDGYEATRALRLVGYQQPIIALTANAVSGARTKCLEAGCDDFATKPIDRATLLSIIRKWLPQEAAV